MRHKILSAICVAFIAIAIIVPVGFRGVLGNGVSNPNASGDQAPAAATGQGSEGSTANSDSGNASGGGSSGGGSYVPGEILVGLHDGVGADQLNERLADLDYVATKSIADDDIMFGYVLLKLADGVNVQDASARIVGESLVDAAQPNFVITAQEDTSAGSWLPDTNVQTAAASSGVGAMATTINDPKCSIQWALGATGAYEAWDYARAEGGVTVAVLDSGVNSGHEDLKNVTLDGYNVIERSTNTSDGYGHGTHVAGIVAAQANNGKGVAGASYNAKILPVKVLDDSGGGNTSLLIAGLKYITDLPDAQRPRIVNMSIGSSSDWSGKDSALSAALNAIHAKGVLLVTAASNVDKTPAPWRSYPVDLDLAADGKTGHEASIGVINAARTYDSTAGVYTYSRSTSSNYNVSNLRTKSLTAPGTNIYSTVKSGSYSYMTGTSMATPCVAGTAALVMAANPSLTAAQVKKILEDTATDMGDEGWDDETGYGMVNAAAAVAVAAAGNKVSLSSAVVSFDDDEVEYSGGEVHPEVTVSIADSRIGGAVKQLVENVDYTLTFENNVNVSTAASKARVTVTGIGAYEGSKQASFSVVPASLSDITLSQMSFVYNGSAQTATATVRGAKDGEQNQVLTEGIDYDLTIPEGRVNVGSYDYIAIGKGNYSGAKTATLQISAAPLDDATVQSAQASVTYSGVAQEPGMIVGLGGKVLTAGTDYTVSYSSNVSAGTAGAVVTGIGNYRGTASATFVIEPAALSSIELSQTSCIYDGAVHSPTAIVYGVKNGEQNQMLHAGVDYDLTVPSGRKEVGTYDYVATGKGNYSGTKTATYTIDPVPAPPELSRIEFSESSFEYDGSAHTPTVTVYGTKNGGAEQVLQKGVDYQLSEPSGRTDAGSYVYTATGIGEYAGTRTATLHVNAAPLDGATVRLAQDRLTFTGAAQEPGVSVNKGNKTLVAGVDYTVSYGNNVNAGSASVTVSGIGNYSSSKQVGFTIDAAPLESVELSSPSCDYDGSAHSSTVAVFGPKSGRQGQQLAEGVDYELAIPSGRTNAGTYDYVVTGKGNYAGSKTATMQVNAISLAGATVQVSPTRYSYTGSAHEPTVSVRLGGKTLVAGTDYSVSYENNVGVGSAAAIVSGLGNYTASAQTNFTIGPASIADATVSVASSSVLYTGGEQKPGVTVKFGERTLVEDVDYSVSYSSNVEVGTARATVYGIGDFQGEKQASFEIAHAPLTRMVLSPQSRFDYDGQAHSVENVIVYGPKNGEQNQVLTEGVDYDLTIPSGRVQPGTYWYVAKGKGNYAYRCLGQMIIGESSLANAVIELSQDRYSYTGTACEPTVTVTLGGKTLVKGEDYSISYSSNVNAGTATVTVAGMGAQSGSKQANFTIEAAEITGVSLSQSSYSYDGAVHSPSVTVYGTKNGRANQALAEGVDYDLSTPSGRAAAGQYTYTATGKGNYKGSRSATMTVKVDSMSNATVSVSSSRVAYTGSAQTPGVIVTLGGKTLAQGTDYSVSYSNNVNVGTATVTVTGKGSYSGSASTTFQIVNASIQYSTHVQNVGWQGYVVDGAMSGTSGRSLRLEGIKIKLSNTLFSGSIEYRTHIQNIGWESSWKTSDQMSGTSGRSLRLEAIQIRLTGDMANHYDVYYRVHCQNFGWLGWAKNGASAGSAGYSYRLEGIEIVLVPKGGVAPGSTSGAFRNSSGALSGVPDSEANILYRTHVQNDGWQNYMRDGEMSGTSGRSLRLEGINVQLGGAAGSGSVRYRTHVQNIGWQDWKYNGTMSGTSGRSLRLEAIQIELTGDVAARYDVYYRVHAQNFGWMGWAKNGESAGTAGYSYRLEGIEIRLVPKGGSAPGSTSGAFRQR